MNKKMNSSRRKIIEEDLRLADIKENIWALLSSRRKIIEEDLRLADIKENIWALLSSRRKIIEEDLRLADIKENIWALLSVRMVKKFRDCETMKNVWDNFYDHTMKGRT